MERGTALSQLTDSPTAQVPAVPEMQANQQFAPPQAAMHTNTGVVGATAPSDNELVDDILKEINQNQTDSAGVTAAAAGGGMSSASGFPQSQQQQQQTDHHTDHQTQHNLPPTSAQDALEYQGAEIDAAATVDTNGTVMSEGERLLHTNASATQDSDVLDMEDTHQHSQPLATGKAVGQTPVESRCSSRFQRHLPWVEKYRPKQLDEVVHHTDIIRLLRVFMRKREMPHLFFYGPPGTGKTSTILSVAHEIYGKHMGTMVLHLNASDERGIDVVRKQIIQFASTTSMFGNTRTLTKMVILDEADSMSHVAQIALRDIMLEYDTLFCFIGNYQFAFQPQLQSRVIKLLFTPIPKAEALRLGTFILQSENQVCSKKVLEKVYDGAEGDMRQFINLLQVIVMRGLMSAVSKQSVFNRNTVDAILCKWNAYEANLFVEEHLLVQPPGPCYDRLHHTIVTTQENTVNEWLTALFETLLMRSLDVAEASFSSETKTKPVAGTNPNANNTNDQQQLLNQTLEFCSDMATIESRLLHTLHPEMQLYALTALTHRFSRLVFPPGTEHK